MDHQPTAGAGGDATRAEADRLLGIAEKLLSSRDLSGAREFAVLAQETHPFLEPAEQILAIADVLSAADRRVNNHPDWYSILQVDRRVAAEDADLIKKNYRRLALVLHPDKNKFPLSESAFKLVADAWAVLSDPGKRSAFDRDVGHLFSRVNLGPKAPPPQQGQFNKLPVRRSPRDITGARQEQEGGATATATAVDRGKTESFWTACPYCYVLYEYAKAYEECCLRCQNCERSFHAAPIPALPPRVPGKEAYYCCWGFFPLGFSLSDSETTAPGKGNSSNPSSAFPNWMPPMFSFNAAPEPLQAATPAGGVPSATPTPPPPRRENPVGVANGGSAPAAVARGGHTSATPRKRGRPRKNPLPA